ncbi:MAG: hypothetical protein WDN67_04170 [Candidatus Moraniibacteriota bacterium]
MDFGIREVETNAHIIGSRARDCNHGVSAAHQGAQIDEEVPKGAV